MVQSRHTCFLPMNAPSPLPSPPVRERVATQSRDRVRGPSWEIPGLAPSHSRGGAWCLVFLWSLVIGVWSFPALAASPRPNVLFIAVDDLNHWVGHLGRNKQVR